jgi:glutaredoxin
MKYILATSKTCGPCKVLKNQLETLDIQIDIKDYSMPENIKWFKDKSIRSVPVLLIEDDNGQEIEIVHSVESILQKLTDVKNNSTIDS